MGPFGVLLLGTVAGWILRPAVERTIAEAVKKAHQEHEANKTASN